MRARKRHFNKSQRRSRGTTDEQVNNCKKRTDIGYDETNIDIRDGLVGKLGGDEPYYLSDEVHNFEIDDEASGETVKRLIK